MFKRIVIIHFICAFIFFSESLTYAASNGASFELRVPFSIGKEVIAVHNGIPYTLGTVIKLPTTTRYPSYTASAWGTPGEVCASAVNALHMLVSVENQKGRTLSIIPQETIAPAAGAGASIVLSTKAGEGIFGAWAPPVGSKVTILKKDGNQAVMNKSNLPANGDILSIAVVERALPYMAVIENRPGGRVTIWDEDGRHFAARVIRPITGIGRFGGTLFQRSGYLRANHCGVIDFSSSKYGEVGGFQIIPWEHALSSKEMQSAWDLTQWMILAPWDGVSQLHGQFPLFRQALVPGTAQNEKLWDVWSTYGRRPVVYARVNGGGWGKLPEISGKDNDGLKEVTHLKIYFPFTKEPQAKK